MHATQSFYQVSLGAHVLLGAAGLFVFWLPALTRKGGKLHRKSGWLYVWAMLGMVVTAALLSLLLLVAPLAAHPITSPLAPTELARHIAHARITGVFFGYIALLTFTAGWQGVRVLRAKSGIAGLCTPFNIGLNAVNVLCGASGILIGRHIGQPLFTFFGVITLLQGAQFLYRLHRNREIKMYWWMDHLTGMLTTGIAAYTGFAVNGGARLFSALFAHAPHLQFIPWVAPTVIGSVCIARLSRVYKRRFAQAAAAFPAVPTSSAPVLSTRAETLPTS